MSARKLTSSIAMTISAVGCVLAIGGGSASAAVTHKVISSFGSFTNVQSVAVDQASGDVYVLDESESDSLFKFNATGEPAEFSSLKTNVIEGIARRLYGSVGESEIAVDNSSGPTKGDIYVASGVRVSIYGSDGAFLGEITKANGETPWPEDGESPCGVAVDSAGAVYVGIRYNFSGNDSQLDEYVPSANPAVNADYKASFPVSGSQFPLCNLAADGEGAVYLDKQSSGPVTKHEAQFGESTELDPVVDENGSTLAVDPSNNDLYVDELNSISQYGSNGAKLGTTEGMGGSYGIAVNGASGSVYVADNAHSRVEIFGPDLIVPDAAVRSASAITITSATLNGTANPDGLPVTKCQFEYGLDSSYGHSLPCAADPGSGNSPVPVSADLTGLEAGSYYHYRLAASNTNGTTYSGDGVLLSSTPPAVEGCPNAIVRSEGASAGLPDCRAYELVSPVDKNGGDVLGRGMMNRSSDSGNAVMYGSTTGFGDTGGSGVAALVQYVAFRGSDGWTTKGIIPTSSTNIAQLFFGSTGVGAFSSDMSHAMVEGYQLPGGEDATPNQLSNLYIESTATRQLETVTKTPETEEINNPFALFGVYRGSSADLGVVIFETAVNMIPQATGSNPKLYSYEHGVVKLVGIMPDNSVPAGGSSAARKPFSGVHDTVSSDGSRILFMSPADGSSSPQLYMRRNQTSTVWVSQSEASSPNPEPQDVKLQAASPDGTKLLFTTTDRLLDSDPGGEGYGLYLYTDSANPQSESNLTFVARISEAEGELSNGRAGAIWGMSDDGSHIYFGSRSESGLPGDGGVYLWNRGEIRQVASEVRASSEEPEVSADGRFLTFFAEEAMTGQAIDGAALYVYDAASSKISCVSCPPSGVAAKAPVEETPDATTAGIEYGESLQRRFLSRDGRYVFFTTADALVPQDTNKLPDVYEYDTKTGKTALLSSGTGNTGSWFAEASPSGDDVFILTRQALTGWDIDKLVDVYDVRVDGGFPEPPQQPVPCDGDACQGTPSAVPNFSSSSGFSGLGNQTARPSQRVNTKSVSHSQLLTKALRACKKQQKRKRRLCEARARKKYAPKSTVKRMSRRVGR